MRNSRFVVALVAVACAAALPAAAAADNSKPGEKSKSHSVKVKHDNGFHKGWSHRGVHLSPVAGQAAKGVVVLKQHANALTVKLVVTKLTPGAFYAAHVHAGTCAAPGAVALALPDVYANEHGVAKLLTSLPTAAGADYLAGGFSVDLHAGPSASATPVISCGDIAPKVSVEKGAAKAWLKGAAEERGHAEVVQKGSDVSVWIKLRGLTPGAHALHLHAGSCATPGAVAVSLGDVTAGPDGTVSTKVAASSSILVAMKGYSLDVHAGASAAPGATVACGDLWSLRWKRGHK